MKPGFKKKIKTLKKSAFKGPEAKCAAVDEFASLKCCSHLGPKAMQVSFDEFQDPGLPLGKKIKEVLALSSVSYPCGCFQESGPAGLIQCL